MASFVLIHGAGHGAWCWRDVLPLLHAAGHRARAIDLPSHGDDRTPPQSVTFDAYVGAVTDALGPDTILVGHSLGGLSITAAADRAPDRVAALVYLCAWVPVPEVPLTEYRAQGTTPALRSASSVDPATDCATFARAAAVELFFQDCAPEDQAYALDRLSPQPMSIHRTPIHLTHPHPNRHYIRCLQDRAIDPAYQRRVSQDWPAGHTHDLDTGHSPFFAAPDRLAAILNDIAKATT
jgi:pimeloyl-ACP methyl ester carboxylesterase